MTSTCIYGVKSNTPSIDGKFHYVYRITNLVENKHYYGKRSSKINPHLDLGTKYFSSSTNKEFLADQKENPTHYKYKVVAIFCKSKIACHREMTLHHKFKVGSSVDFYNVVSSSTSKFDTTGTATVRDKIGNIFQVSVYDPRYISGEFTGTLTGRVVIKKQDGSTMSVKRDDQRYISGEFVSYLKDTVVMQDRDGNIYRFQPGDERINSCEYSKFDGHKNTIVVKDKNGIFTRVAKTDPRYEAGELTHLRIGEKHKKETLDLFSQQRKNKVTVRDKDRNYFKVCCDDPRIASGELEYGSTGMKKYNDGIEEYMYYPDQEVPLHLKLGQLPRSHLLGKKWYNNGLIQIKVFPGSEPPGFIPGFKPRKTKLL